MRVEQVMSKNVASCDIGETAHRAAQLMWEFDVGVVPVLEAGVLVGMATDRDITMAAYMRGVPLAQIELRSVMTRDVCFCRPDDEVSVVEDLMGDHQVRRLPVLRGGELVGLISLVDIARASSRSPDEVTPFELGRTLSAIGQRRPLGLA